MLGLERTITRSGNDSIGHAKTPGAHDDVANATAGALLAAMAKRPQAWVGAADVNGQVHYLAKNNPHLLPQRPLRIVNIDEHGRELTVEEAQAIRRGERRKA